MLREIVGNIIDKLLVENFELNRDQSGDELDEFVGEKYHQYSNGYT